MNTTEHGVPHFHAKYNEFKASISIDNFGLLAGKLPPKQLGKVVEWAAKHQEELRSNWLLAKETKPVNKIKI